MPIISSYPDVPRAYNRVEVNWADTPAVRYARVLRVDVETGQCVPLRPYICYDGDYLLLSCGHGIFWDTEVPLDRSVYYITEGLDAPCIPDPDPCVPCAPVTASTVDSPTTMPSNGAFRLRDPQRPCNDIYMPLCFDQDNLADINGQHCIPGSGVFFASMETEAFDPNSLVLSPVNTELPLSISRTRRGISSTLTVVTRTFADRDNLKALARPGSPVLIQGPPQYGVDDQYMDVRTVAYDRGLTDHRFQARIATLPYVQVRRPIGPQQGVCGSQVGDLCDFTWDDLAGEGFNWDDLVRGRATGGLADYRTWDDVLAEFADWNDVDDGTRTWHDVEVGD